MNQNRSKLSALGGYTEVDDLGFLLKTAAPERIQEHWKPAIAEVVSVFVEQFGSTLHSAYVRGSVAEGRAIAGHSDLDTFAIVDVSVLQGAADDGRWTKMASDIAARYPFITHVELQAVSLSRIHRSRTAQFMMQTQAVCVHGRDLSPEFPRFKPGLDAASSFRHVKNALKANLFRLAHESNEDFTRYWCAWGMKKVLRTAFELVMERERRFTRDLVLCCESFCKYYPDRTREMYTILDLAINPSHDRAVVLAVTHECLKWLPPEIERVFGRPSRSSEDGRTSFLS